MRHLRVTTSSVPSQNASVVVVAKVAAEVGGGDDDDDDDDACPSPAFVLSASTSPVPS